MFPSKLLSSSTCYNNRISHILRSVDSIIVETRTCTTNNIHRPRHRLIRSRCYSITRSSNNDVVSSSSSAETKVDTVIIGAGVIGIAIARALSLASSITNSTKKPLSDEIIIVDRATRIGAETSSRNSEVIHGGFYYAPTAYKSIFCRKGRQQIYDYCKQHNIVTNRCGKLVVAPTASQSNQQKLQKLYDIAQRTNLTNIKLVSEDDVKYMEPNVRAVGGALYSPDTGILDSHTFIHQLLADAENTGFVTLALQSNVEDARIIESSDPNYKIQLNIDGMWLSCRRVINCAGLWANRIARMMHRNRNDKNQGIAPSLSSSSYIPPPIYYATGTYFQYQHHSSVPFHHLIYPLPEDDGGGLGIHATLDLTGTQIKFGPDVQWIPPDQEHPSPDTISLNPDPTKADNFYNAIRAYWPDLPDDSLQADYVGIRPKLYHPSLLVNQGTTNNNNKMNSPPFQDFRIDTSKQHHIPGLIHLYGIESPGLTSSMAIADYIVRLIQQQEDQ